MRISSLLLLSLTAQISLGLNSKYYFENNSVDRFGYISISKPTEVDAIRQQPDSLEETVAQWENIRQHIRNQSKPSLTGWQRYAVISFRAKKLNKAIEEFENRIATKIKITYGPVNFSKVSAEEFLVYGYLYSLKSLSQDQMHMKWPDYSTPIFHFKMLESFRALNYSQKSEKLMKMCAMEYFQEYSIARSMASNIQQEKYDYNLALYQSLLHLFGTKSCPIDSKASLNFAVEASSKSTQNARALYIIAIMNEYPNLKKSKEISSKIINSPELLTWEVKKLKQIIEK